MSNRSRSRGNRDKIKGDKPNEDDADDMNFSQVWDSLGVTENDLNIVARLQQASKLVEEGKLRKEVYEQLLATSKRELSSKTKSKTKSTSTSSSKRSERPHLPSSSLTTNNSPSSSRNKAPFFGRLMRTSTSNGTVQEPEQEGSSNSNSSRLRRRGSGSLKTLTRTLSGRFERGRSKRSPPSASDTARPPSATPALTATNNVSSSGRPLSSMLSKMSSPGALRRAQHHKNDQHQELKLNPLVGSMGVVGQPPLSRKPIIEGLLKVKDSENEATLKVVQLHKKAHDANEWATRYFVLYKTYLVFYKLSSAQRKKSQKDADWTMPLHTGKEPLGVFYLNPDCYVSEVARERESRPHTPRSKTAGWDSDDGASSVSLTSEQGDSDAPAHQTQFVVSDMNHRMVLAAASHELQEFWMHTLATVLKKVRKDTDHPVHLDKPIPTGEQRENDLKSRLSAYEKSRSNNARKSENDRSTSRSRSKKKSSSSRSPSASSSSSRRHRRTRLKRSTTEDNAVVRSQSRKHRSRSSSSSVNSGTGGGKGSNSNTNTKNARVNEIKNHTGSESRRHRRGSSRSDSWIMKKRGQLLKTKEHRQQQHSSRGGHEKSSDDEDEMIELLDGVDKRVLARLDTQDEELDQIRKLAAVWKRKAEKATIEAHQLREKAQQNRREAKKSKSKMKRMLAELKAKSLERETALLAERDAVMKMLEKSQKRRKSVASGKGLNGSAEEYEIEKKALLAKLDALQSALQVNLDELDWDGSLDDAETKMKALVEDMCSDDAALSHEATRQFEQWDKIVRNHVDYRKRELDGRREWDEANFERNQEALKRMKALIPPIFGRGATIEELVRKSGKKLSKEAAKHVLATQILRIIYMDDDHIAKIHIADLSSRYVPQGLDINELRAVQACLPSEFQNDRDGRKKAWLESLRTKLTDMTNRESNGQLTPAEVLHISYRPPGWKPPPGTTGNHGLSPVGGAGGTGGGARQSGNLKGNHGGGRSHKTRGGGGGRLVGKIDTSALQAALAGKLVDMRGGGKISSKRGRTKKKREEDTGPVGPFGKVPAAVLASRQSMEEAENKNKSSSSSSGGGPVGAFGRVPPQVLASIRLAEEQAALAAGKSTKTGSHSGKHNVTSTALAASAGSVRGAKTGDQRNQQHSRNRQSQTPSKGAGFFDKVSNIFAADESTTQVVRKSTRRRDRIAERTGGREAQKRSEHTTPRVKKSISSSDLRQQNRDVSRSKSSSRRRSAELSSTEEEEEDKDMSSLSSSSSSGGAKSRRRREHNRAASSGPSRRKSLFEKTQPSRTTSGDIDAAVDKMIQRIRKHGARDRREGGVATITYGDLLEVYGGKDMLVGLLLRAKKKKRVVYDADMLGPSTQRIKITVLF